MKRPTLPILLVAMSALLVTGCSREANRDRVLQRAHSYFESADFERALIEYRNVLQLDPKNATAMERIGTLWLERGAPLRALPFLLEARALRPDDRAVQLKTLQIALGSGKFSEVREGALAMLARSPRDGDALLLLSETVRGPEQYQRARQALDKIANQDAAAFHLANANLSLHEGNANAVAASLRRALELEPNSARAHAAMAKFHLAQNDVTSAEQELELAASLAPLRSNERLTLLQFKASRGEVAAAIDGLKALVAQAPDYLPAWRVLAEIAGNEGRHEEAQAHLRTIFALDSTNFEGRLLQAQLALARNETERAITDLAALAAEFPGLAAPKFALAQARLRSGDVANAMAALHEAIVQQPDHEQAILLLATLHLRAGNAERALWALADFLTRRPHLGRAQLLLADALGALGKTAELKTLLQAALNNAPENATAHYLLGVVLAREGNLPAARRSLTTALERRPDFLAATQELVLLDVREGEFEAARKRVEAQLARHARVPALHLLDARVHVAEARWEEAEAAALRALELEGSNALAYEVLAKCHGAKKNEPDAHARLETFVSERKSDPGALLMAGNVYLEWGEHPKARAAYEGYLALQRNSPVVLNNLAYLYSEDPDRLDRALELARAAHELAPNSPEIADTLGWIHYQREEYARACELLETSAAKRPHDARIQEHWRLASERLAAQRVVR